MQVFRRKARFIPGALLICGTCVGAGMLGLPVETGPAGLYPALIINILSYLLMLLTGLYFMEATLWMPDQSNLISMSQKFFGRFGQWASGFFFLFLYYCLMVAYVSGGAPLFDNLLFSWGIDLGGSAWPFTLLFGAIILVGARFVGRINILLMIGFGLSYLLLLGAGTPQVDTSRFAMQNWRLSLFAAPVLLSAYGFHNIIPSLSTYLERDRKQLTLSILIGTTLSFVIYSLWQWVIIGALPPELILEAKELGVPVTEVLERLTKQPWIRSLGQFFGFFALTTSLLGVSLSMVDFLGDAFSWERRGLKRLLLCLLVFIPPTLLANAYPGIFMSALGLAGGIGEAILNGLIPAALVFVGTYRMGMKSFLGKLNSKLLLFLTVAITLIIMGVELWSLYSMS